MMRMCRIAVLSTVALPLLASCGEPDRPADDPQVVPPAESAAEATGSAQQDEFSPAAVDSTAETQSTGQQSGSAGQADAMYPLLWDRLEPASGPPPVTAPAVQAPLAPRWVEPEPVQAQPAPARARIVPVQPRPSPPADSAAADSLAEDSARA